MQSRQGVDDGLRPTLTLSTGRGRRSWTWAWEPEGPVPIGAPPKTLKGQPTPNGETAPPSQASQAAALTWHRMLEQRQSSPHPDPRAFAVIRRELVEHVKFAGKTMLCDAPGLREMIVAQIHQRHAMAVAPGTPFDMAEAYLEAAAGLGGLLYRLSKAPVAVANGHDAGPLLPPDPPAYLREGP